MRLSLLPSLLAIVIASTANAADHGNLETSFPLEVEDAYPIGRNGIEVQALTRYRDLRDDPDGRNLVEVTPRIEWGAFPNGQITLELPYFLGNGSMAESGEVGIEALYNFNTETLRFPAFSVAAGLDKPYGVDGDAGLEGSVSVLATMSLGTFDRRGRSPYSYVARQVHLNATYFHNFDPLPEERDDRFSIGLGYSQPLTNDFVFVADVFREFEREQGVATNLVEIGGRYILTPQTILSASIGHAYGNDRSEDTRVTIGIQHALSYPYWR